MNSKDIDAVRENDKEMVDQLHSAATLYHTPRLDEIADRLAALTTKAHERLHWTGSE